MPAAALPPGPNEGCALIVGLEHYDDPRWRDLPGAAASAARFAGWLLTRGICDASRITLITSASETGYLAPAFTGIAAAPIKWIRQKDARADFETWITGPHGPRPEDRFFYLFWAGHGVAYPDPYDPRVCLVTAEANEQEIAHVELLDLLTEAGKIAPDAYQAGFVGTCREEVMADRATALSRGQRFVTAPREKIPANSDFYDDMSGENGPPERSIALAASHGQSTWTAGFAVPTFPDYILAALRRLPDGGRPEQLFPDFLAEFAVRVESDEEPAQEDPIPVVLEYRHLRTRSDRTFRPPRSHDDADLTRAEWAALRDIAASIDAEERGSDTEPVLADLCWAAYCHAVGLEQALLVTGTGVQRAAQVDGAADLIRSLRDLPAPQGKPPRLISGCDFLANLATPVFGDLAAWCAAWGADTSPGGRASRLAQVIRARPRRFRGQECLSIMIDGVRFTADDEVECGITAMLAATGGTAQVLPPRKAAGAEVIDTPLRLIGWLQSARIVPDFTEMLVEWVLPRQLLVRRLEYEGRTPLGQLNPVVIRDLETIRDDRNGRARAEAMAALKRIKSHPAGEPWSHRIGWLACERRGTQDRQDIGRDVLAPGTFVIAIPHSYQRMTTFRERWAAPMAMEYSIDMGAPIIISLHAECDLCERKTGNRCQALNYRTSIETIVDAPGQWRGGPADLPAILKDFRRQRDSKGLQIGVLIYPDRPISWYLPLTSAADWSEN